MHENERDRERTKINKHAISQLLDLYLLVDRITIVTANRLNNTLIES